jgi:hypothetical protein
MSIFDGVSKSKAQQRYESIKEKSPNVLNGEKNRCRAMFDELWSGLTMAEAQEVLDLFGAEAMSLFSVHSAWQQFIKTVDPTYEPLVPPYDVSVVEGRVILSEKPQPEQQPESEPEPIIEPTPPEEEIPVIIPEPIPNPEENQ